MKNHIGQGKQNAPAYPCLPKNKDKRLKITPALKNKMRVLKKQGLSDRAIAGIIRVNHTTVRYHTNEDYRERKNKKTCERLASRVFDAHRSDIQKRSREHRIKTLGYTAVNTFERENRRATRHLHTDYRRTCPVCHKRRSIRLTPICCIKK